MHHTEKVSAFCSQTHVPGRSVCMCKCPDQLPSPPIEREKAHCRQTKATPKRKVTVKDEDAEDDEEDEDDDDQEDKAFQPKNTTAKEAKPNKAATKASKEGPENSSMTANKNPSGDVDIVHQNIQDKYYMHKYKERDLNKGKGDLDGLVPYTVAQILKVETKKGKNSSGVNVLFLPVAPAAFARSPLCSPQFHVSF